MTTKTYGKTVQGIVCGHRHLTPAESEDQVVRAAEGFRQLEVEQGDCVAIFMRNDIPFLVASRAAAYLGAYAVPVNWHLSGEELAYILGDCRAGVLIVHADLWRSHSEHIPDNIECIVVETPYDVGRAYDLDPEACCAPGGVRTWSSWLEQCEPFRGEPHAGATSMIYTSGTTGKPKGVRRPPSAPEEMERLAAFVGRTLGCRAGSRCMIPGPLYHSAPNGYAMMAFRQAELVLIPPRFDAEQFLAQVERYALTGAIMAPIMFIRLLKLPETIRNRYDLSSLDFIVHGAAPCPPDVKRSMIDWFGPVVNEYYGSTESGVIVVCNSQDSLAKPGTVGKVVPEADVRILDGDGNPAPVGELGEVYSRFGDRDFTYNNKPEARSAIDVDGYITSGDMGYFDEDGYLYVVDRAKDMVISGGVNIYPAEIEAVLHTFSGIKDCAVFGIPDEEFGESVMAVLEPEEGMELSDDEVRAYLRQHLAGFKVPKIIETGHDLPREDSGKIFKRRLRARYWENANRRI
jgi:long-chain acyl-CoA synthetase